MQPEPSHDILEILQQPVYKNFFKWLFWRDLIVSVFVAYSLIFW